MFFTKHHFQFWIPLDSEERAAPVPAAEVAVQVETLVQVEVLDFLFRCNPS